MLFIWHTRVTPPQPSLSAVEINPCSVFRKRSHFCHIGVQLKLFEDSDFNITNVCFVVLCTQTAFWRGLIDFALPVIFIHPLCRLVRGWSQFSKVTCDLGCFTSVTDTTSVKINNKLNHSRQRDQWKSGCELQEGKGLYIFNLERNWKKITLWLHQQ